MQLMSCVQGSICFEMMKGVPAGVVTLIIGGIAGVITWRQYKLAQAKLKLDLFERRYKIFHQTWDAVVDTAIKGTKDDNDGLFTPFTNFRPEAAFLFGKDIEDYVDELARNWNELSIVEGDNNFMTGDQILKNIARSTELRKWFNQEGSKGVKAKFAPYLDFANWK
jgi:hypothetical protein